MYNNERVHYTSCTRFGDKRAIGELKRPFATVEEMDAEMVRRWNEAVKETDTVWHLGGFGDFTKVKQLNGEINILLSEYDGYLSRENDDYDDMNPREYIDCYLTAMGFNQVFLPGDIVEGYVDGYGIPEDYRSYTMSHKTLDEQCRRDKYPMFSVVGEYYGQKERCVECTLCVAQDMWDFTLMNEGDLLVYSLGCEDVVYGVH